MRDGEPCSPAPLPPALLKAAVEVAEDLGLAKNWLNNGPSQNEGGLFQMGLPDGFEQRLESNRFGTALTIHFAGRLDQIHFKLYASVDRGGYHIDDLQQLSPSSSELEAAARWAMTHDVFESFAGVLKGLLGILRYENVAGRL